MFPYMIETKGVGNYAPAFEHAQNAIKNISPQEIAQNAQVKYDEEAPALQLASLGVGITVTLPECAVTFTGTDEIPILEWRLVVLHYLGSADGADLSGELAHFRQMPGGRAYESAFIKRSVDILVGQICDKPVENIKKVFTALGGRLMEGIADVQAEFMFMPKFPIMVQIWAKDDEMAATANVLFDKRANHYLPTEDMAVAASLLARFIMKQYKIMFG